MCCSMILRCDAPMAVAASTLRKSPAAFFRGVPPTSPLAVLPSPVLWGVSSPSGGRAAPPQPLLRCALAAPVAGGVVASRVPCGHPASGGVAGALFPSASTLPSLPFDPHRHHLSRHMSKAAGCDAAQAQRMPLHTGVPWACAPLLTAEESLKQ